MIELIIEMSRLLFYQQFILPLLELKLLIETFLVSQTIASLIILLDISRTSRHRILVKSLYLHTTVLALLLITLIILEQTNPGHILGLLQPRFNKCLHILSLSSFAYLCIHQTLILLDLSICIVHNRLRTLKSTTNLLPLHFRPKSTKSARIIIQTLHTFIKICMSTLNLTVDLVGMLLFIETIHLWLAIRAIWVQFRGHKNRYILMVSRFILFNMMKYTILIVFLRKLYFVFKIR